jgi:hypothetical protein
MEEGDDKARMDLVQDAPETILFSGFILNWSISIAGTGLVGFDLFAPQYVFCEAFLLHFVCWFKKRW